MRAYGPKSPDPTEDEIRDQCERIRAEWSAKVRESRRVGGVPEQWQPPEYNAAALGLHYEAEQG